jgi:hypothetical protein
MPQDLEPPLDEMASVATEGGHIGYSAQSDQVKGAVSQIGVQRSSELVGDTNPGKMDKRVTGGQAVRVDNGDGRGQGIAGHMMIGDNEICTKGADQGRGILSAYTCVAGDDQGCAIGDDTLQVDLVQAVALVAGWHVEGDVSTQCDEQLE